MHSGFSKLLPQRLFPPVDKLPDLPPFKGCNTRRLSMSVGIISSGKLPCQDHVSSDELCHCFCFLTEDRQLKAARSYLVSVSLVATGNERDMTSKLGPSVETLYIERPSKSLSAERVFAESCLTDMEDLAKELWLWEVVENGAGLLSWVLKDRLT